jgi:hypothetical protein
MMTWYVDSSGGGNGSASNPFGLAGMLASSLIAPGDTVLFAAGTYGTITTTQKGTATSPITYRASGRVVIDGLVNASASQHVNFVGFDITDTTSFADGRPADLSVGTSGYTPGEGCKLINCIVKNHLQGMLGGSSLSNYGLYGNLFLFNGSDSNLGHGAYAQHNNTNGYADIVRNILIDNFAWNIHAYGTEILQNFRILENISAAAGSIRSEVKTNIQLGGTAGIASSLLDSNVTYHYDNGIGMTVGWGVNSWSDIVVSNNSNASPQTAMIYYNLDAGECETTGNKLYGNISGFTAEQYPENIFDTFANAPYGYFLTSNAYDANRAQLAIFNPSAASAVQVDVSAVFGQTGTVLVHNCQDYWVDIQTLTITAGVITIDMQAAARTIETPVGWAAPETTFPQFGAFVVRKA